MEGQTELSPKACENTGKQDDDGVEYESDPDDALPLTLRRKEASDEEDEEVPARRHRRVVIGSDGDSEGEGRPAAYEEEEESDLEEEEAYEEEEEEEEERGRDAGDRTVPVVQAVSSVTNVRGTVTQDKENEARAEPDYEGEVKEMASTEEKKQIEPYAVPTAGAFYMHDDRCRDSGGARHRRTTPGGRKLWESKDERAWTHDRFEEMSIKEEKFTERRRSGGQFRGRGRTRGRERGSARGNHSRNFDENKSNKPPNQPERVVKGRGPRQYEAARSNVDTMLSHDKQPVKSSYTLAKSGGGRSSSATPSSQSEPAAPKKHAFGSSLSSASPPFYPSGSSNQDTSAARKRDLQNGNAVKTSGSSISLDDIPVVSNSSSMLTRGKASVDPIVHDRVYADHPVLPVAGKTLPNAQIQPSGSSSVIAARPHLPKVQERGFTVPSPITYQFIQSSTPIQRLPPESSVAVHQRTTQGQSNRSVQNLSQLAGGGHHETPHNLPAPSTKTLPEVSEVESPPGCNRSKSPPVGMGKPINQASGKGFLYGGAQVIGAAGATSGSRDDQNFPPALLPVMQFGGQHHGGLGVPAVGMAFPGYVGQPQEGLGNSEMTWLPVLTGAAGALGASYAPYFAIDGGYYPPALGPTSSSAASRDSSTDRSTNTIKAPDRSDPANDEYGQRQNKPQRYSEMNFGQ